MPKLIGLIGLFVCLKVTAQLPEDALRASWITPIGTARTQAIGGAMGSLGGDITSAIVNPAGLGLYRTSEAVVTPGWRFLLDKGNYLGGGRTAPSINKFNLGSSGFVFSYPGANPGVNNAFVISVNRTADFSSNISYKGLNDYSSFAEQYAEEFAGSGHFGDVDGAIADPGLSYGTRMALYSYLVDTVTINGQLNVVAQPQKAGRVWQENNLLSTGGITEIDLSLGSGHYDKWYFGGSLGIPIMNYTRMQTYTESDATGNPNNDFESFTYRETYTSKGWGINGKFGVIFRPTNALRLGLAIHTPSVFGITDQIHASMITRTENYAGQVSINSDSIDAITGSNPANTVKYSLYTPWKFLVSGSYVFGGGQSDVKQQKGFITADLEYILASHAHFGSATDDNNSSDNGYFDAVNQAVRNTYKNILAARLGGEMKFNTFMARAGAAWYGNPYSENQLKADRLLLSAGIGYRNQGFFMDLTYVLAFNRDVHFPYRLSDKANTYADLKETAGTLLLTAGIKF